MTIEGDLLAAINPICPRVFPEFAPFNTPRPYVTYQQIGGEVIKYGDKSVPSIENGELQFNVFADTRAAAKLVIKQIEAALIQSTVFEASPVSAAVSDYDHDNQRYGFRQDFSIWSDR